MMFPVRIVHIERRNPSIYTGQGPRIWIKKIPFTSVNKIPRITTPSRHAQKHPNIIKLNGSVYSLGVHYFQLYKLSFLAFLHQTHIYWSKIITTHLITKLGKAIFCKRIKRAFRVLKLYNGTPSVPCQYEPSS